MNEFQNWFEQGTWSQTVTEAVGKLWQRVEQYAISYDHPNAHRTSNMLDRLMNHQDRLLYTMQYFHGSTTSARLYLRSMALVWNFHPYGARTRSNCPERMSPFTELNGFRYHDNWLHNLLIASSMNGRSSLQSG